MHLVQNGSAAIQGSRYVLRSRVRVRWSGNDPSCTRKAPCHPPHVQTPQQDDKVEVVESNEEDVGVAVYICCFNAAPYKGIDIWVRIDQIQDVQHLPCDVDPVHVAELESSSHHHGVDYSRVLISVTAVQPFVEPFDPLRLFEL